MNSNYYRNGEDLHFKMTTPEEEVDLFRKVKAGDEIAREFLIRNHLLFVAMYARRKNKGKLPDDEIISAVNAALMSAIGRFDPERGNRFTQYLIPFLRGAMATLWKEKNVVSPESHAEDFPEFTPYKEETSNEEGGHIHPMSTTTQQRISEMVPATDEIVSKAEGLKLDLAMLLKGRARLSPTEKALLKLIYEDKVSMADIARSRGVSRQAVFAAHLAIVEKLRAYFNR